ncbi:hypothetical protein AWZ03_012525 [Drosophila navojoa]|uniref:Secreted protein n=1 Tax=Drosophila navojoa TaxID=7232 RepID=A0A484AXC5_DRONA|nr:hypothetical protein AWZ03_012525 [Drosophila navojoa]
MFAPAPAPLAFRLLPPASCLLLFPMQGRVLSIARVIAPSPSPAKLMGSHQFHLLAIRQTSTPAPAPAPIPLATGACLVAGCFGLRSICQRFDSNSNSNSDSNSKRMREL